MHVIYCMSETILLRKEKFGNERFIEKFKIKMERSGDGMNIYFTIEYFKNISNSGKKLCSFSISFDHATN